MQGTGWRFGARVAALMAGLAMLGGCANAPPWQGSNGLLHDELFAPPAQPVVASEALAISPAMRRYLVEKIAIRANSDDRRKALIEALYRAGALKLDYDASATRSAAQAFESRSGNCLSLVMMTGAFAKALGLDVRYQQVRTDDVWDRAGDLVFAVGHINLALAEPTRSRAPTRESQNELVVDFQPPSGLERMNYRIVDEATVTAMYLNNRAAEALAEGRIDDAYAWVRESVQVAIHYLPAYNTLGVIYRQRGRPALAEAVFTRLLAQQPDDPRVLSNLVVALRDLGRGADADRIAQRLARIEPDPPYALFRRAMTALDAGDLPAARELLGREVARAPYQHEFQFWLGVVQARLGDAKGAAEHFKVAIETSPTRGTRELYSAKLARLRAADSAH